MEAALPVPLLGRGRELAIVEERLRERSVLLTLTGPPGIGKTRLAQEIAARHDGVFAPLVAARDVDGVTVEIARALGCRLGDATSHEARIETLARALAREPKLLVLDNAEHVAAEVSACVRVLVASTPPACIIVTSRQALGLESEILIELAPLAATSGLGDGDGVLLFADRARRIQADFRLDESNRQVVRELVRLLDGLPLAIELAAARMRLMDAEGLLQRLRERGAGLSSARRGGWSSLEEAIDWSWQLLSEVERSVLAQCTVFASEFDLEAAEHVVECANDPIDVLQSLRDKSLLAVSGRPARIRVYESIRRFVADRVAEETLGPARVRHAEHFLGIASEHAVAADAGVLRSLQRLSRVRSELLNIVEGRALHVDDRAAALLAVNAINETDGVDERQRLAFDALLAVEALPPALRGRLLLERAGLRRHVGDLGASRRDVDQALQLATGTGDRELEANALRRRGMLEIDTGDPAAAEASLAEACRIHAGRGDRVREGIALSSLARAQYARGRLDDAEASCRRALPLHRETGLELWEGLTRGYLAYIAMDRGAVSEARHELEWCIERFRALGSESYEGALLGVLGSLHHLEGRLDEALVRFEQARDLMSVLGRRRLAAIHAGHAATVRVEDGDERDGSMRLRATIDTLEEIGDAANRGFFSAWLGGAAAALGELDDAARYLADASSIVEKGSSSAMVEVHRARLAVARGAIEEARAGLARAAKISEAADVRIARRWVERALRQAKPEEVSLTVGERGVFFALEDTQVDLASRPVLARMLWALTTEMIERPGAIIDSDALIQATWPGERMSPDSATSRLHATVRRLRRAAFVERGSRTSWSIGTTAIDSRRGRGSRSAEASARVAPKGSA